MTGKGVILYGPPASGKDTITAELHRRDPRFVLLTKLKAGTGRTTGYRSVDAEELQALREAGRLVAETHRYGNVYAIDRADIDAVTAAGGIPVVHVSKLRDLEKLADAGPLDWIRVLLWVPRDVSALRSEERGDSDCAKRVQVWEESAAELAGIDQAAVFGLTIETDQTEVADSAQQIADAVIPR